jgi:hypothetical protein
MKQQIKHWQDPLTGLLGVWLMAAPWALGFAQSTTPTVNSVLVGLALVAAALGATFVPRAWEEWTEVALGVWLVISPWVLAFDGMRIAKMNTVVVAIAVLVLALWVLATDKDYKHWGTPAH